MPVPMEIITLLGSTIVGGLLKLWGMSSQSKKELAQMQLSLLQTKTKAVEAARTFKNEGFMWTRRTIALLTVLAVVVWPKIVPVFWPDIPVTLGWTEWQSGFLFFTEGKDVMQWHTSKGLVVTPLDTHLLAMIGGLYFGSSITGHRR